MDLGVGLPVSGSWANPASIRRLAASTEDLGYTSLWTFQRLLVAADQRLGTPYRSVLDSVAALGFAAAVTGRVRLGTAVLNAPFIAPAVVAKQLATIDVLSEGRLDAGLGLGWSEAEFIAAGIPYARRGARTEEFVACLRAVWGPDPVRFDGEFYRVPESSVLPKPVQSPAPPILLGGMAPPSLRRAGRISDGWISSSRADLSAIGASIQLVREAAEQAGRDPDRLRFVCRGVVVVGERRGPLTGNDDQIRGDLAELAGQGVTETFLDLNFDPSIGNPDAAPADALRRAEDTLEALAP